MEKTSKEIIENYAHDFRDMPMSQENLEKMLWQFWKESEQEMRQSHLDQFCARIDSHGFKEWYRNS